jgi:hypothetical protein
MTDPTPSTSNRFEEQVDGTNLNTWGSEHLNPTIQLIDDAFDGLTALDLTSLSGEITLTAVNFASDQSRERTLKFTGTPAGAITIIIPHVTKWYWAINQTGQVVSISDGTNTLQIPPGNWCINNTLVEFILVHPSTPPSIPVKTITGSAYTALLTDAFSVLLMKNIGGTIDLSVFDNAPNGTQIEIRSTTAGIVVTVPGDGFTTATMGPADYLLLRTNGAGLMEYMAHSSDIVFA